MVPLSWLQSLNSSEIGGKNELSFNFSDILFIKTNLNGLVLDCNNSFCSYFSISKVNVLGSNFFSHYYIDSSVKNDSTNLDWQCYPVMDKYNRVVELEFKTPMGLRQGINDGPTILPIIEKSSEIILILNNDLEFVYTNPTSLMTFNYLDEELLGKSLSTLFRYKKDYKEFTQKFTNEFIDEAILQTKDEKEIPALLNVVFLRDQKADVKNYVILASNLSDQNKKNIQHLTTSAEFRSIFESFPDLFLRVDQQGKILDFLCSPSNEFYAPEEKVIGTRIQDLFPLKIKQELYHAIFNAEKTKEIYSVEFSNQAKNQLKYYEARVLPFFNKQTTINIRDITANKKAEEALRNSEARLRSIWDTSYDGMALIDSSGNIISVNLALCRLFNITEEEVINKRSFNLLEYIDPNFIKSYEKRKIPRFLELKVKVKGDTRYIDLTNTIIESEGKDKSYLFTIFHDITLRVLDKKSLLLKTIKLEIIKEVISSANESGTLSELFNKVLQTVLQTLNFDGGGIYIIRKEEELAEMIFNSRLSPSLSKALKLVSTTQAPFNTVFNNGENFLCKDYKNVNPDFAEKFKIKTMFLVPIKIKDTTIGALYLKSEEIQSFSDDENVLLLSIGKALGSSINRIKTNELLRKSEQKFRSVWENSIEPMRLTDCTGTIITVNKAFCDLFDIERVKIIGEKYSVVYNNDFELVNSRKNIIKILNEPPALRSREIKMETKSRRQCTLEIAYSSILGPDEDLLLLTTFHDLTQRIKTEEELRISQKLAAVGKMAAYLSHEIKTPLTTIKLNFDLMKDSLSSSGIQNYSFNIVQKEINRLEKLLKDVLNYSRESDFNFEMLYVPTLINNIMEFLQPVLKDKNIDLDLRIEEHFIKGDPQKLHSMFLHLLENSIDAIGENGKLEVYSSKDIITNQYTMYIKDSGCGIVDKERLFDPFFSSKKSGTGLGLPIAMNIMKKHNGSIELVSSSPGETIFAIYFPGNI